MQLNKQNLQMIVKHWLSEFEPGDFQMNEIPGGLSGAKLWKVSCENQIYCLRRWPTGRPTQSELSHIHALIKHVWSSGFAIVPLPRFNREGLTCARFDGHLWEVNNWLPGTSVEKLSLPQIDSALKTLAEFHHAAASHVITRPGPAPGLVQRLTILQQLHNGSLVQLEQAVHRQRGPDRDIASRILADLRLVLPMAIQHVGKSSTLCCQLQSCLRDIHRGNLLFTENQVSGLVDFGAAAIDSVAGDVARLASSIAGDDVQVRQICLASYEKNHSLTRDELRLIAAYEIGGLVAAASNWLRWLFVEHREFADPYAVHSRLSELGIRLRSLVEREGQSLFGTSRENELDS